MKYLNQRDYPHWRYVTGTSMDQERREKGQHTTVRTSGCGLCSAVMVADQLIPNCTFELQDALRLSYDLEANHRGGTDYHRFAPVFAKKLGLRLEETEDPQRFLSCLQTGGVAVILSCGDRDGYVGLFSHGRHYITAIGVEPDGRIAILDPSLTDGKYDEEGRVGKAEITHNFVLLCKPEDVIADADTGTTAFNLFWRK